jgi:hypothetical protein
VAEVEEEVEEEVVVVVVVGEQLKHEKRRTTRAKEKRCINCRWCMSPQVVLVDLGLASLLGGLVPLCLWAVGKAG